MQVAEITADPVLTRLRSALDELYGARIERVVLFGSRARGDAHSESDYDVAVFLRDLPDRWAEAWRLADLCTQLIGETGEVVNALVFAAGAYNARTPLMHELRLEGVDIAPSASGTSFCETVTWRGFSQPEQPPYQAGGNEITPEAALYLRKARHSLDEGRAMIEIGFPDAAGRAAYLAGFHAAQALIFQRGGRAVKTHRGVRARFAELAASEPALSNEFRGFLGRGYELKTTADYGIDPNDDISIEQARDALDTAERLVTRITELLSPEGFSPTG